MKDIVKLKLSRLLDQTQQDELNCWNIRQSSDNTAIAPLSCQSVEHVETHPDSRDDDVSTDTVISSVVLGNKISDIELEKATADILNSKSDEVLNRETQLYDEDDTEINHQLINMVLNETTRAEDGRLIMPLTWKAKVSSSLASNLGLAKKVLKANEKKLFKDETRLHMMDEVFKEQEKLGIIERVDDKSFLTQNPQYSFLAHMGVFKLDRETSKCRIVFLSNLCQKTNNKIQLSHNQVIHAGPNLNNKITTALLHLRFDERLLCFDIRKAFLQVLLHEKDSCKLLFLWYKNVAKRNFSLITYIQRRLPFGLRCSPFILMMSLFKILCVDAETDEPRLKNLKLLMYSLMYVDNGAVSGTADDVEYAYVKLISIFFPYQFEVQQLTTNDLNLQCRIDEKQNINTDDTVKLLGLCWNRVRDTLSTKSINLNGEAVTKRLILSSIAQQFDMYGFHAPFMVRARLFMHTLQYDKSLTWDDKLAPELLKEWRRICKQTNSSPVLQFPRCIGSLNGKYELRGYTDASKCIYSVVIYLHDLVSGKVSFVCAKNRIVNNQLLTKTIPSLELQAVTLGVECIVELKTELSGRKCMVPVNFISCKLFTDSLITLHWINSYTHKLDKMQKRSVFVLNRLEYIARKCENNQITFCFMSTNENPADCLTRPCSYGKLIKTSFITGNVPSLYDSGVLSDFRVAVPNPHLPESVEVHANAVQLCIPGELIPPDRFSTIRKLVRCTRCVLKYVRNSKYAVQRRNHLRFPDFTFESEADLSAKAFKLILKVDQQRYFSGLFNFLQTRNVPIRDIPPLITRLNIFVDADCLLRVRSKFGRDEYKFPLGYTFPVLLAHDSKLTKLIIHSFHVNLAHSGCYNVLSVLRKKFYIPKPFSTVKRILKDCVTCKKLNARPVKLNQNSYREFRASPPDVPFRSVFLDYLGPFYVKNTDSREKIWLLAITCLWSRAINLKISPDMSVNSFLRSFQTHVFEHGLPGRVASDLGSQLVAGADIITDHLNSVESKAFLAENRIGAVEFNQYFKENRAMGSLVKICVKLTKRVIYGTIKKNVLDREDFNFIVSQTIHLLNKRPIACKEAYVIHPLMFLIR